MPPSLDDSNFAEESVKRVSVSFVYTIRFKQFANAANVVSDIEKDFERFIFEQYIDCNSLGQDPVERQLRARSRQQLQVVDMNEPIGVSTGSKDERAMDIMCAANVEGEECVPMNGKFELLFTDVATISPNQEENSILTAIKEAIQNRKLNPSNPDTRALQYFGKREGTFAAQDGIMSSSLTQDLTKVGNDKDGVSAIGGVLIGASFILVALVLFAGNRRRKSVRFERENQGALTSLREYKEDYDLIEIRPDDDKNTLESASYLESPDHNTSTSPFPLILPIVKLGENSEDSVEVEYQTRDVHRCSSALCPQCSQHNRSLDKQIRFIHSSEWYDDVEIDFSHNDRFYDEHSVRTYDTPNTVTL